MPARARLRRLSFQAGILLASVAAGCLFAPVTHCADQPPPQDQENFFKRAAKVIGHDAKTGAMQAGHAFKLLGKDIGHGTSKTVKDIGHGMKESAKRTGRQAKETFK